MSDAIKLPIEKGQMFLSRNDVGEVVSVARKDKRCVVWIGEEIGDIRLFHKDGKVDCGRDDEYDLQPLPVVITEGAEFCGPEYRDEFERLVKEGREFEYTDNEGRTRRGGLFGFCDSNAYRLVPHHADANGNVLKVGDRVECRRGMRITIVEITNGMVIDAGLNSENIEHCRLLTTIKRPLCADDLMANRTALFRCDGGEFIYPISSFDNAFAYLENTPHEYGYLQEKWEWSPSADQPWQPCEVTEEALA